MPSRQPMKLQHCLFWFCLVLGWFQSSILQAEPMVPREGSPLTISEYPGYLIDPTGQLTVDQLTASMLPKHSKANPTFGWTNDAIWLVSEWHKPDTLAYILEIGYPLLDEIDIYLFHQGTLIKHLKAGDSVSNSPEILDHIDPAFAFPSAPGDYRIMLKVHTSSSLQAPLKLYTANDFIRKEKEEFLITGVYGGILSIMAIYNLFIFLASRNFAYLFYSSFVFTFLLVQLSLSGHSAAYFWPGFPGISDIMICQGGIIATGFMVMFSNLFLDIHKMGYRRRWLIRGLLTFGLLALLASCFTPYVIGVKMMAASSLLSVSCVFVIAAYQMMQGQREAKFYIAAWSIFITGFIIYMLKQMGILPINLLTSISFKGGSVIEVSLLSLALADRLNSMRAQLKKVNDDLRHLNENLETIVHEKTLDIRSIMANIRQGVFQIKMQGSSLEIDQEYSAFLQKWFPDQKIAGSDPLTAIFSKSSLSDNEQAMLTSILQSTIGEAHLAFEMNESNLPREMNLDDRLIELEWSSIVDAKAITHKILVTMKDVTDLRHYQNEALKRAREFQLLGEVARQDARRMEELIQVIEDLFTTSIKLLQPHSKQLAMVFRNLHTIKGLARNFDFKNLTDCVHAAEQSLKDLQSRPDKELAYEQLRAKIQAAFALFQEYKHINDHVLGRGRLVDNVLVSRGELKAIQTMLQQVKNLSELKQIEARILFLFEARLEQVIADEMTMLGSIARTLGKPTPNFSFQGDQIMIPNALKKTLRKAFVHLLRNSIDHGIESSENRQKAGKAAQGSIFVDIEEQQDTLILRYRDDGRGLAIKSIRERATQLGIIDNQRLFTAKEIADFIFIPGFSTAQSTTDISGRGIGMDAVKSYIEEAGGLIAIELADDVAPDYVAMTFVMTFPFVQSRLSAVS